MVMKVISGWEWKLMSRWGRMEDWGMRKGKEKRGRGGEERGRRRDVKYDESIPSDLIV